MYFASTASPVGSGAAGAWAETGSVPAAIASTAAANSVRIDVFMTSVLSRESLESTVPQRGESRHALVSDILMAPQALTGVPAQVLQMISTLLLAVTLTAAGVSAPPPPQAVPAGSPGTITVEQAVSTVLARAPSRQSAQAKRDAAKIGRGVVRLVAQP